MSKNNIKIQSHYGVYGLADRILDALDAAGHNISDLNTKILNLVDQLHSGGLSPTIVQCLKKVRFTNIEIRNGAKLAAEAAKRSASELRLSVMMGQDMPDCQTNLVRSIKEGRLIGIVITAQRPV
jgi:hypothetical protein